MKTNCNDGGKNYGHLKDKFMAESKKDKYSAVWVSHSSIGDFLKCPRAYFLHNIYRTKDNRKINLVSPTLSLGQVVHETLENLSNYKAEIRFLQPLEGAFEENWKKVSGKTGGFKSQEEENDAKERARKMVLRVQQNPGPLLNKTLKIKSGEGATLPNYFLSEKENIILCGKIDWLEYIEKDDSVRVIDFKTGKNKEDENSLQMLVYLLLLNALQKRKVSGAAYWYLEKENEPSPVVLPEISASQQKVLDIAMKIKTAKERGIFECPRGIKGCFACQPYEKVAKGEAEYVGIGGYNQELYLV